MPETEPPRPIERVRRPFQLDIALPGSKSIALRHVLMSLLADAPTSLDGVPRCDDVDVMFDAAERLGARVRRQGEAAWIRPACTAPGEVTLDLGMSGVSLRLLLAHAALRSTTTQFTGHAQLHHRPNADLLQALQSMGCHVSAAAGGVLPIAVAGPSRAPTRATLRTGVTSQYLSSLLLCAPALANGLTIHLRGKRTSASYIEVTRNEMARRGVSVEAADEDALRVAPAKYCGGQVAIEGDASAATYHAALATLHAGRVAFTNLGAATTQGDFAFLSLCERAGATVRRGGRTTTVQGPKQLAPLDHADMSDMPDAAPTLMAMAPFLPTPTRLTGLATLRVKECDRLRAGTTELRKAGVRVDEEAEAMTIHPAAAPRPAAFDTYEDHRMAMALAVFASRVGGCEVRGPDCVAKTYADFWRDFQRIYDGA